MAGPLLETKLHVPRLRRGLVARPRLSERLSRGAESALTLVSAPAGFGKTTLLTEWLADAPADGRSAAWLSLDQRDNDPAMFWTYLDRRAADGIARGRCRCARAAAVAPGADRSGPGHAAQRPRRRLGRASCWCSTTTTSSTRATSTTGMAFLLEHLPPQIHLVIASRADPALPLARLRGRGELVEIRAADLRFTPDEAATYLNEVMGLVLTRGGRRSAGGAHGGVDRRAPAGGALDAGPRRRRRLHRGLRRGRPVHRRLPGRRGLAAPARKCPELPAEDLHPEPAERLTLRCRDRPGRRQGHAGGSRSREPVPGPARRPPPVVPLPASLCRRAASAPARRAAGPRP